MKKKYGRQTLISAERCTAMPADAKRRVLVVGTTSDYIDLLYRSNRDNIVFLTDSAVRKRAAEPPLPEDAEVLVSFDNIEKMLQALATHMREHRYSLDGIACFDCESMLHASHIAAGYSLPYPSPEAIFNCRDKFSARKCWQEQNIDSPPFRLVKTLEDAIGFFNEIDMPVVLKPVSGSGGELVFLCENAFDLRKYYQLLQRGLQERKKNRLYQSAGNRGGVLAEARLNGKEYSCDFIIDNQRIFILRTTRKLFFQKGCFGTVSGYSIFPFSSVCKDEFGLRNQLKQSAQALGLDRAFCMADFIVQNDRIYLLEIAPRPGGDTIPSLLRAGLNLDTLQLYIDFSKRIPISKDFKSGSSMTALRIYAPRAGILKKIDVHTAQTDGRIREITLTRKPGHVIQMPPEDYESWIMGHVLFLPEENAPVEEQCRDILKKIVIGIS